ncbi:MAG: phosphoglycerate kinase [Candidatus Omnitrophota bacterium]|nr:MAG: phosphoglycerate kinase [Candidatus Omnitrophota bacterium]
MNKKSVKDIAMKDKRIIVRVDFNVPLDGQSRVSDDARIRAALPTLQHILAQQPRKLILMSHLGRPKGKVVEGLRMNPVASRLSQLLGESVEKLDDCVGEQVTNIIESAPARVILLENLRFHPEEEKGDEGFARKLASLADVYVNDAFGTAHRAHASTTIVAKYLPSCVGFLMEKEVTFLSSALSPQKPYVVILGGAKVSDKIDIISNLMKAADTLLIGGAMAYTFLKAQGESVGNSKVEEDKLDLAKNILEEAGTHNVQILLPTDHLVVENIDNPDSKKVTTDIDEGFVGVDIGPRTIDRFKAVLQQAKTVLWNGPVGIFENDDYAKGTEEIALYLGSLQGVTVIVGGGDSAAAAKKFGVVDKLSHVSTGGGASLEFLEGKQLPGIAIIPNQ